MLIRNLVSVEPGTPNQGICHHEMDCFYNGILTPSKQAIILDQNQRCYCCDVLAHTLTQQVPVAVEVEKTVSKKRKSPSTNQPKAKKLKSKALTFKAHYKSRLNKKVLQLVNAKSKRTKSLTFQFPHTNGESHKAVVDEILKESPVFFKKSASLDDGYFQLRRLQLLEPTNKYKVRNYGEISGGYKMYFEISRSIIITGETWTNWLRYRTILIGFKSSGSPLSKLPKDIFKLIVAESIEKLPIALAEYLSYKYKFIS